MKSETWRRKQVSKKHKAMHMFLKCPTKIKFYRKKQKQSKSLVEMLAFPEKGHAASGHGLLVGKQKWPGTSPMTARRGPQRPAACSPSLGMF